MKISVIIPSFNQGEFLEETIRSVVEQSYKDIELIVIDGGSQDQTCEILRKHERQLSYWVSEKDTGQSNAINKGFANATGEIVTWLGSDDLYVPDTLQTVVTTFARHPEVGLIHANTMYQYPDGKRVEGITSSEGFPYKYLSGMSFAQPSSFFRRTHLEKVGFLDETLHYGMDYDLMIRLFDFGKTLQLSNFLSVYRYHPHSKSTKDKEKFANEWARIFSKVVVSVNPNSFLISLMKNLQLFQEPTTIYTFTQRYSEEFLYRSFLYFLYFQIVFLYQAPRVNRVKPLVRWLKEFEPEFFHQQKLQVVYNRVHYLNDTIIKYARRISAHV